MELGGALDNNKKIMVMPTESTSKIGDSIQRNSEIINDISEKVQAMIVENKKMTEQTKMMTVLAKRIADKLNVDVSDLE